MNRLKWFLLIMAVALVSGCTQPLLSEKPAKIVVRLKTTPSLNPDANDRPSPIVLRLYHLKTDGAFNNARFFELWDNGESTLGGDLLGEQEIELYPEQTRELEFHATNTDTRFLGIIASYRNLDNAVWRTTIQTPLSDTTFVHVVLGKLSVSATEGKKRSTFLTD